jgi:hypothetical protein
MADAKKYGGRRITDHPELRLVTGCGSVTPDAAPGFTRVDGEEVAPMRTIWSRITHRELITVAVLLVLASLLLADRLPAATKKTRGGGSTWLHPKFASFDVRRIAMLPAVSFDNNVEVELQVGAILAQTLPEGGYRWIAAPTARDLLQGPSAADTLLPRTRREILEGSRIDSLSAPQLCGFLRSDAVLSVRIDQYEKVEYEKDPKAPLRQGPTRLDSPIITVDLKAAMVDSTGTLLWSASTSRTERNVNRDPRMVVREIAALWARRFPTRKAETTTEPGAESHD